MQLNEIKNTEWGFSLNGVGEVAQGLDDIRQCIKIILATNLGTDPLRPFFGCNMDFLDKPINKVIPEATKSIIDAVTLWEPRVDIISLTHSIDGYELTFNIKFKVKNTVDIGQVDITYGLK